MFDLVQETTKEKKEKSEKCHQEDTTQKTQTNQTNHKNQKNQKSKRNKKLAPEDPQKMTRERSGSEEHGEELEIDLNAAVPLSRKKQRLLKKGKLDLEKIARKHPAPRPATEDGDETAAGNFDGKSGGKSPHGVWIGNLHFETTKEDIVRYIVAKTQSNTTEETPAVKESDISRVNLPKKDNKIKGFAYVDLPSQSHVASVIALSETNLGGRNLLIKNASSFEGRPENHGGIELLLRNSPLRILFVGNLSFDTTEELLEEHFRSCGKIVNIRIATFEDTGKCKGFAFVDFLRENGATTALKSKNIRVFINRPLRLEYGENRSKRNPKRQENASDGGSNGSARFSADHKDANDTPREKITEMEHPAYRHVPKVHKRTSEWPFESGKKRMKSSVALATAQRASAAIVPSQGKKKTFD